MRNERESSKGKEQPPDDPTRHAESPTTPPGQDHGEEREEKIAGRGNDVSDDEAYEGGLPG